jgi:hypothetical protein
MEMLAKGNNVSGIIITHTASEELKHQAEEYAERKAWEGQEEAQMHN